MKLIQQIANLAMAYIIKIVDNSPEGYDDNWWNATTEAWVASEFKNPVTLEDVNIWEEFEVEIASFPVGYDVGTTVEFYEPQVSTVSGFNAFYIVLYVVYLLSHSLFKYSSASINAFFEGLGLKPNSSFDFEIS